MLNPGSRILRTWPAILLASLVGILTPRPGMGDTNWYISDVFEYYAGHTTSAPLIEFGHLAWRPLAAALYSAEHAVPLPAAHPDSELAWSLAIFSVLLGIASAAVMYDIALGLGASPLLALLISANLLCANACLTYFKSGNAYVPGMFCVTVALWFALQSTEAAHHRRAALSGAAIAAATIFWFPNVLLLPPVLAAILVAKTKDWKLASWLCSERIARLFAALAGFAAVVIAGYLAAALLRGIHSASAFLAWYRDADHGWAQNRTYLRAISGFARMLFDLSNDGLALKRYAFHDPYAPVTLKTLLLSVAWKLALFYLCVAAALYAFRSGKRHQESVVIFAAGLATLGFFAIVLFEPSTPSRFISLLPFWSLAVTTGILDTGGPRLIIGLRKTLLLAVPTLAAVLNLWGVTFENPCSGAIPARFDQIQAAAHPGDLALAITNQDDLYYVSDQCHVHANIAPALVVRNLVEIGGKSALAWRANLARDAAEAWDHGANLWVPKRLLSATPAPSWNWAEGDNPQLKWPSLPAFFHRLDYDADIGGPDGFLRLAHDPQNTNLLKSP